MPLAAFSTEPIGITLSRVLTEQSTQFSVMLGLQLIRRGGLVRVTQQLVRSSQRANNRESGDRESYDSDHRTYFKVGLLGGVGLFVTATCKEQEPEETAVEDEKVVEIAEGEDGGEKPKKKKKKGFGERKVMEYENRIREFSTPDKIFRYFATVRVEFETGKKEIFMTPKDFMRSITPGELQPSHLGLDLYRDVPATKLLDHVDEGEGDEPEFLSRLAEHGLISFQDYIFLLTLLSTPKHDCEIAFKMFDLYGDGCVSYQEFLDTRSVLESRSSMGKRHRDNIYSGNTINKDGHSALTRYFFGKDSNKKLTLDDFVVFMDGLKKDVFRMEFNKYDPVDGIISEQDFAHLLLLHATLSHQVKSKFIRRVKKAYKNVEDSPGITFDQFMTFNHFLDHLDDVEILVSVYFAAGMKFNKSSLRQVAHVVADVELDPHIVDVVFTIFDDNGDELLSNREFISVLKERAHRGLEKPSDTGFVRLITALGACVASYVKGDEL